MRKHIRVNYNPQIIREKTYELPNGFEIICKEIRWNGQSRFYIAIYNDKLTDVRNGIDEYLPFREPVKDISLYDRAEANEQFLYLKHYYENYDL